MKDALLRLERRARFAMGALAIVLLLAAACVKAGWISTAQAYKPEAWYAVDDRGSLVITTEHATESDCRAENMINASICRSGKSLVADVAGKQADAVSLLPQ